MDTFIAIGHVAGSMISMSILAFLVQLIGLWEEEKNQKKFLEELSINLVVPVENLTDKEVFPAVVQHLSRKYSSDLIRNRVSDLFGTMQDIWGWLGVIIYWGVMASVIWLTIMVDIEVAIYAWFSILVMLFFYITSIAFALLCKLLTGRYPRQAREARKRLAEYVNTMSENS